MTSNLMNGFRGVLTLGLGFLAIASAGAADPPIRREWSVNGVKREALVYVPVRSDAGNTPLIFVFHGHGGSMRQAAKGIPIHEHWPQAVVVYMQGLPTPGLLTDPEGKKTGWQARPGDQKDRDLKFFDTVSRVLKAELKIDANRVYATGHSNGGSFTYLLWSQRADGFAAFGPSAAIAPRGYGPLMPRPVIHIAAENDELVKFAWQKRMIDSLRKTNQCGEGRAVGKSGCVRYDSKIGAPVVTYIHAGTHNYPAEATALIVEFFKGASRTDSAVRKNQK